MTKQSNTHHNKVAHNEMYNMTKSEGEDILEMKIHEINQQQTKDKKKKRKKEAKT